MESETNASFTVPFAVGDVISNKTLYTAFKCACEGGIRYSSANRLLALVSNFTDPRHTGGEWKNNVFYFIGSGKSGDQDIAKGANKRLEESLRGSIPVYYFEVHKRGEYTYMGRAISAGEPFQRLEQGADGEKRKVWVFPLRLIAS